MSPCSHALFAVYVSAAAIALAGLWPNMVEAQPMVYQMEIINKFEQDVELIKMIMFTDRLWWSVLKGTIQLKLIRYLKPIDHYSADAKNNDKSPFTIPVEPFTAIVGLMKSNYNNPDTLYLGSHVKFVMETIRGALTCSVLRHLSFQGSLVFNLLSKIPERWGASLQIVRWLERMIRLSIDKLAALEIEQLDVAAMHFYTRRLLDVMESIKGDSPDDRNQIQIISEIMYKTLKSQCIKNDQPVYKTLVEDLKRVMGPNALKYFETMVINERLSGVPEMNDMKDLLKHHGQLKINGDVLLSDLGKFNAVELKKIITVNWVYMMFVYLNLPINTMADKQWANLFQRETLDVDKIENIVRNRRS